MDNKYKQFLQSKILLEHDAEHHEGETQMLLSSLLEIIENATVLINVIKDMNEVPAWVSAKIALADDYLISASGFLKNRVAVDMIHSANETEETDSDLF